MCYNLSDPRKYEKVNSIATYEEFQKYINHSVYPLHLDIALPIHSWAVYIRNAKFKGIVNGISQEEIAKNTDLFEPVANQRYKFLRDTVIGETYYRYGDEFRIEQVDLQTLLGFANILADHIKMDISSRISFFSWDAQFYNRFSKNEYNRIYKTISQ